MIFDELKELEEQYEQGTIPDADELSGEYYVVVPWFPWLSFELLKHRKAVGAGGEGDNVLLKGLRFGHFKLEKEEDALLIDYDLPENRRIMQRVVDRLRWLPDGRLVGKLYYRILGRKVFIMFFEMRLKEMDS